ncbi:uncharacterized protein LOC121798539 [Salvia splendens]|nr:uncharacterized protein LOC121798539 [Salvia splendens]
MDCALRIAPSSPKVSSLHYRLHSNSRVLHRIGYGIPCSDAVLLNSSLFASPARVVRCDVRRISSLESLFCYDKPIPEEIIEKPVGLALTEKDVGENPRCSSCLSKGATLCATCSGSGLYVDSILESQGIIVKVRCLGCGGTGNTMCSECGGRGHL